MFIVPTQRPTREALIALAESDPGAIADLVLQLWDRVEALEARVRDLERNSRNSSRPPSSDRGSLNPPPKPKSLREKSGRKPGGQDGHAGETLLQSDCPDRVVEHRAERRVCPACAATVTAAFPSGVTSPVQYGESVQAAAVYFNVRQMIPYARTAELLADLFACPMSQGTLASFVKRAGAKAAVAMGPVREKLVGADIAHADETGCRVGGKLRWLHVLSTAKLTSYHIDAKRGGEGMNRIGLLGRFTGWLVHDFLSGYYLFGCLHQLCAAHLLRELIYLKEQMDQPWAGKMIALLLDAKDLAERERSRAEGTRRVIGERTRQRINVGYAEIVLEGLALNPEPASPPPGTRGRVKRSKALNLLIRLEDRYEEIMGFFEHPGVPFDNNQAERDLRMMKVREKISGTFRSEGHAEAFCDLRAVLSSANKQDHNLLGTLAELLRSPEALGEKLARG